VDARLKARARQIDFVKVLRFIAPIEKGKILKIIEQFIPLFLLVIQRGCIITD